jgi:hypothetical protein
LDAEAARHWRRQELNSTEILLCQRLTRQMLTRNGGALQRANVDFLCLLCSALSWLPKAAPAFLLNSGSIRSPLAASRRRTVEIVIHPLDLSESRAIVGAEHFLRGTRLISSGVRTIKARPATDGLERSEARPLDPGCCSVKSQ